MFMLTDNVMVVDRRLQSEIVSPTSAWRAFVFISSGLQNSSSAAVHPPPAEAIDMWSMGVAVFEVAIVCTIFEGRRSMMR